MSIRKLQDTSHEKSNKTDYPSLHEIIKIEDEVRTALKSIKNKKERFRVWTKSLGDSTKIDEMFVKFDVRISQLSAKLEYLEKVRTQVARGEILPHEIPHYVAKATDEFVKPDSPELGESDLNNRDLSTRTDEPPKHDLHKEMEPVSSTPQKFTEKEIPDSKQTSVPSGELEFPEEQHEKSEVPATKEIPERPLKLADSTRMLPVEASGADLTSSEKIEKPKAGELFETILEEINSDEAEASESRVSREDFSFVLEEDDTPNDALSKSEADAAESAETAAEEPAAEIDEIDAGATVAPEATEVSAAETDPETEAVPVDAVLQTEADAAASTETAAEEPAAEIDEIDTGATVAPEATEVPAVESEPETEAVPVDAVLQTEADAVASTETAAEEPAAEIDEIDTGATVAPEATKVSAAETEPETEAVPVDAVPRTEADAVASTETAAEEPETKVEKTADEEVFENETPSHEAVTEKAIDSIFARNLVLKKKSKVVKDNLNDTDASQTEIDGTEAAANQSDLPKRSWKRVGQSIPEEKLPELIDEASDDEILEAASPGAVQQESSLEVEEQADKEKFSKYIRPKLPEPILKKQYDNYLAEKSHSEPVEEPDLSDLDLARIEDEAQDEADSKREKIFSVKKIKSRFSLRRFKKSKEDKHTMETGKATAPKETRVEPTVKEETLKEKTQLKGETAEPVEDKSVLYLGIDLGTSETTIAASNGVVETVLSVMGKPKDFISQKLLKADQLFGLDALRNKLAVTLFRPMEKGVIKDTEADLEAARELVKYVISLAKPDDYEKVFAVIGAPARSSFANQQALVDAAREVVDAVMIVSEPFAVAYGEGKIYNSLVIDIGAGTTDICCLKGSMPEEEDQFTLLKAGDYIDNFLMGQILTKFEGAQVTKDLARKFKEEYSYVIEPDRNAVVEITVQGKPTKIDITKDIKEACESIIPEIITCSKNIIANFNPEFQKELKENIMLAGGGSLIKNLDQYLERQLRALGAVNVSLVPDPIIAGAKGALSLAKDLTDEYWRAL